MATVTVEYTQFQQLKDELVQAKKDLDVAGDKIADALLGNQDSLARVQLEAIVHLIEIARFTMGSTTPMMTPGWPHESLRSLAALLPRLTGLDPAIQIMTRDWQLYADDAKKWEDARVEGRLQALLDEDNARRGLNLDSFGLGDDAISTHLRPGD